MEEAKEALKKGIKVVVKSLTKILLPVLLIIAVIIALLAAATYFLTVDDGTYKEDDWSSTPYAAGQYTSSVSVNSDGTLSSGTSSQDLWDRMLENGSRVDEYLDTPEELARLMRAEIVTQYPDTRSNPDEDINWDDIVNSDTLQGIIKFKRADSDSNTSTMSYVDPETFQSYIDEYNSSGSATAKQNALTHFTIKTVANSSSSGRRVDTSTYGQSGDGYDSLTVVGNRNYKNYKQYLGSYASQSYWGGTVSSDGCGPTSVAIIASGYGIDKTPGDICSIITSSYGNYTNSVNLSSALNDIGLSNSRETASDYGADTAIEHIKNNLQNGNPVLAGVSGATGKYSSGSHWIAVLSIDSDGDTITVSNPGRSETPQTGSLSELVRNEILPSGSYILITEGSNNSSSSTGATSDTASGSSTSATPDTASSTSTSPTGTGEAKIDNNYDLNDGGYASIFTSGTTGRQYKEYKQNIDGWDSRYPISHLANSSGWRSECGVVSVMIVGSGYTENSNFEDATQKMEGSNGSSQLATWLSEYTGQSCNFLGSMTTKDEFANKLSDGCVAVVHSSDSRVTSSGTHFMAVLDISSDKTQVYLSNPWNNDSMNGWLSIDTVYSLLDNIAFVTNDGSSVDYGSGGTSSSGGNSSTNTVVVATWKQVDTTVTTNDPNVQAKDDTQYIMTTTNINYEEMVGPYTMPFDLLWALLVEGEDKDFVFELADLVYGSDIIITVYDNLTVNTDVDDWHYTQRTKAVVNATITATCNGESETGRITNDEHDPHSETNYQTTKTVVTQTNTVKAVLTRANVWFVDYQNDYTYVAPTETSTPSTVPKPDEDYPSSPDSTGNSYSCQEIDDERSRLKSIVQERAEQNNANSANPDEASSYDPTAPLEPNTQNYTVTFNESINVKYYNKYINITDNITNTISTQKYIQGTPSVKEKTDPNSSEDNFVTIFNKSKYRKNKSNILNTTSWFFEIIENNDSTKEMVDLMKYLLYKATGRDYGKTEFDFSIYDATKFQTASGTMVGGASYSSLTLSDSDMQVLYKLVQAEGGGGTHEQLMYHTCVVLNRVLLSSYPDTVSEVANQSGQFEVMWNGMYDAAVPTSETISAVDEALQTGDITGGAIGFQNDWLFDGSNGPPTWGSNWFELFRETWPSGSVVVYFTERGQQQELNQYE